MNNSQEEDRIIEAVLAHCRNGSTDQEAQIMRIPVGEYTSARYFHREVQTFMREYPLIVGHVSALAELGAFFTHDLFGVPLLVTRTRAGKVRAFLNVCRHRGAKVETRQSGTANTFSCPYHGWTYGADGLLRGLRHAPGFGDIDREEFSLVELPAFERFGLLWVKPSPSDEPLDIDGWLAPMSEQLQSLRLADHVLFKAWTVPLNMNWHIALEGFQEQYHFCSAHKHTACAAYLDNQGIYLDQYPHVRHAVPVAGFEKLADVPVRERSYRAHFMTQNYLFPCHFVQVMTDHVYVHTITPTATDACVFSCMMLIPETVSGAKAERHWQANYEVVRRVFDEDFAIGASIQAGLAAGANTHFTVGRYEVGLQMSRRALNDALAGRLPVPTLRQT